jgi:hypothetical protein
LPDFGLAPALLKAVEKRRHGGRDTAVPQYVRALIEGGV